MVLSKGLNLGLPQLAHELIDRNSHFSGYLLLNISWISSVEVIYSVQGAPCLLKAGIGFRDVSLGS